MGLSRREFFPVMGMGIVALARGSIIVPNEKYQPGRGIQSFNWLDMDVPIGHLFNSHDQAVLNYAGKAPRPTGELVEWLRGVRREMLPGQQGWLGDCLAASIASGILPRIEGSKEAFGVNMSWVERMVLASTFYTGSKIEQAWGRVSPDGQYAQNIDERGPITPAEYQYIQDIQAWLSHSKEQMCLVVDTATVRGKPPGEEWWVHLSGFNGENLVCTDFVNWAGMGRSPTRLMFQEFPYSRADRIALVNSTQPHPGLENNYHLILNREVASVFLDINKTLT